MGKIAAQDLKPEHRVLVQDKDGNTGLQTLASFSLLTQDEEVFDCSVEEMHRYCANGIVVSNCSEQSLEHRELCNLVEIFLNKIHSLEEFLETVQLAFLYAKTVTLGQCKDWPETDEVMSRNRRIGTSMTGIVQFLYRENEETLIDWCNKGYAEILKYDEQISTFWKIPKSVKHTSIKPSGTVSLLAGATPGVHFPISRCYIRRIRLMKESELIPVIKAAGYKIEDCVGSEKTTVVVEFPVKLEEDIPTEREVTIERKMEIAALLQRYWADNQVSVTVSFDQAKEGHKIAGLLKEYEGKLKSVSFLPYTDNATPYPQMPYENITTEQYHAMVANLKPLSFSRKEKLSDEETDFGCESGACLREQK